MTSKLKLGQTLFLFLLTLALTSYLARQLQLMPPQALMTDLISPNLPPFSQGHLFGTDNLGRDLASMLWTGALGTMAVALTAALSAAFFGYLFGAVSALIGGIIDNFLMRLVDALLSIPSIILLLTISALITAPEFTKLLPDLLLRALSVSSYSDGLLPFFSVVAAIAATGWLESARVARALVLKLKEEDYFIAAQSLGAGSWHLLRQHILPALVGIALLEATLLTADAIIMESGLSFLGLGLGASTPSWGSMLRDAQPGLLAGNFWAALLPGLLISTAVIAIHLLCEGYMDTVSHGIRTRAR